LVVIFILWSETKRNLILENDFQRYLNRFKTDLEQSKAGWKPFDHAECNSLKVPISNGSHPWRSDVWSFDSREVYYYM